MGLHQEFIKHHQDLYPHYYLCHYQRTSDGKNILSTSLLRFKHSEQLDLACWTDCSIEMLAAAPILPNTLIIRALQHQETQTQPNTSLDYFGQHLAQHFHSQYQPLLLQKSAPCHAIKDFVRHEREQELRDLYSVNPRHLPALHACSSLLVIDDVLTTGTTVKMIIDAVRPRLDTGIRIFTLAKTGSSISPNQPGSTHDRHYLPEQLKSAIRSNIF